MLLILRLAAAAGLITALGGCATVVEGVNQPFTVEAYPRTAECEISREGQLLGVTNDANRTIRISKSKLDLLVSAQPFKSGAPLGHDVWARIDRLELPCRLVVELQHARASGRPEPFYARYPRCEGSRSCSETVDQLLDNLAGALLEEPAHGELSTELPADVKEWARGPLSHNRV